MIRLLILAGTEPEAANLAELAAEDDRIEIVASVAMTGPSLRIEEIRPDVVLVSGIPVPQVTFADVPVVNLTDSPFDPLNDDNSVRAHLPNSATPAQLLAAIAAVAHGFIVLTPAQAERQFRIPKSKEDVSTPVEPLTSRELQVLRMIARGLANKEIADQLGISEHTAKFHVASILGKLRVSSRAEAVTHGIRKGLVPI